MFDPPTVTHRFVLACGSGDLDAVERHRTQRDHARCLAQPPALPEQPPQRLAGAQPEVADAAKVGRLPCRQEPATEVVGCQPGDAARGKHLVAPAIQQQRPHQPGGG
jgi:hypothetical protein